MTLEIGLLVLESVLLVFTIVLLLYSLKEGRQRDKLIKEVGRATKILTRQEYFLAIIDSMMDAREEIIGCITGRMPTGDDRKMARDIIETIKRLRDKGVKIKYLMPKFPDRLHIGVLYSDAGAEVYYSSCLMVHNLRFIVIDSRVVVIGIPESTGEKEATKKGYVIPSEGLAVVLKNYFYACEDQVSLRDYLKEVINQTGANVDQLAREYKLDPANLRRFLE
jgi:hypothetical protein